MKWLKRIVLAILVLVVALALIGFFLPGRYRVEKSVVIKAKPEAIFNPLQNLKTWNDWTAWNTRRFPDMKNKYSGPESGEGSQVNWEGNSSGQGSLTLTKADPKEGIEYKMSFDHGKFASTGSVKYTPEGDGVRVTWVNEGDLGWDPVS